MDKEKGSLNTPTETRRWTPLHLAIHHGDEQITELLLEEGANVHAITLDGLTPMGRLIRRTFIH